MKRSGDEFMRKILLILLSGLTALSLSACLEETIVSVRLVNPTTEYVFFRRYDEGLFVYSEVSIRPSYEDMPNPSAIDRPALKAYYDQKHQQFLNLTGLSTSTYHDEAFLSSYTAFIQLTYTDKEGLMNAFSLLHDIVKKDLGSVTIQLCTIDETYEIRKDSTFWHFFELSSKYHGVTESMESIPFQVIEIRRRDPYSDVYPSEILPEITQHPGLIIRDFDTYLIYFPENHYQIQETFFESKVILYVSGIRSGSEMIVMVKGVQPFGNTLEIVLDIEQQSIFITEDAITFKIVLSMDKDDLPNHVTGVAFFRHTNIMSGYLSEKPYDTRERPAS